MSYDDDAENCGFAVLLEFLRDSRADLDTSCIGETVPPQFEGHARMAFEFFGTDDLWENQ